MYILMVCTLMLSRHLVIRVMVGLALQLLRFEGWELWLGMDSSLTMVGDITRVHGAAGMSGYWGGFYGGGWWGSSSTGVQ